MDYPTFYRLVEKIQLYDPLADFLGSLTDGHIEFSYLDIVKAAGHSCPTVAGAYLMCLHGLKQLYSNLLPVRGQIKVEFKESVDDGVAGVVGAVFSHITGATEKHGFKGISGNFVRHSLMAFNTSTQSSVRLTRMDSRKTIELIYNPKSIPATSEQQELFSIMMQQQATKEQKLRFAQLWQARVEQILCGAVLENGVLTIIKC